MVIQKMSELVVTTDSPIEDRDEDSSEDQQGPLSSISENPASPMTSLGNEEPDIKDLDDLSSKTQERIAHFFEHYKDLEKGKWVKLLGWGNKLEALEIIRDSIKQGAK